MSRAEEAILNLHPRPLSIAIAAMLMLSGCAGYKELKAPCSPDEGTPLTSLGGGSPLAFAEPETTAGGALPAALAGDQKAAAVIPAEAAASDTAGGDRCGPMKPI